MRVLLAAGQVYPGRILNLGEVAPQRPLVEGNQVVRPALVVFVPGYGRAGGG